MLIHSRVAIVGLGLMGGSVALALRGQCAELWGVEPNLAAVETALAQRVIDWAVDFETAMRCELVIFAAPVQSILTQLHLLGNVAPTQRPVLLDLGSTKSAIVQAMQALPPHFDPLGGHPLCGKEVSGLAHAEAGLFQDKVFVLTPLPRTSPQALALAHELIAALGAHPLLLDAAQHDAVVALTSHLPYLVAINLMQTALAAEDAGVWALAASGFRDTSRLASSDLTMMLDILQTNQPAVLAALESYQAQLGKLQQLLQNGDWETLRNLLAVAREKRGEVWS